jgi:type I restriction enzyme R subunit
MPLNTKESGLETLIVKWLIEQNGFEQGASADYNREYAVDEINYQVRRVW